MMSRSHRARAVRPAESPVEDLRRTHDAWTRDLLDRLPHDSDSSDGNTPPRARATRHRSPTRDARREPRHRAPARAAPEETSVSTGALERQIAGLTSAIQMLVEQQAAQLHGQERLRADMVQMLARQQNVAAGEVVPDAPETGPSSAGAWDGRDHAGTLPRLAEELPYKDGLLSWTEENVGELFACIAYKHLTSVDDATDNEEAGTQAQEIKVAARNEGIDGRALLHLTIEDMKQIGETAGVVAGGGECALSQVGHRISILNSLVAFRDAHAHEPWDRVKELPLIRSQGLDRNKGAAKLTEQLCKTFGVDQIQGDNDDKALKAAMVHRSSKPKASKAPEVIVPVFATLLVKKIIEDTDGNLNLVGAFIQRPLLYDLASFARTSGKETLPYFDMRINEGEAQSEDCFDMRQVARDMSEGAQADVRTNQKGYFATAAANFVTTLPLKLNTAFGEPPFKIVSATVLIELTSFLGKNDENELFELRPSFVAHASDLRMLCSVRDWLEDYKMDESSSWNFVTIMPTIEYEYDGGKGKKSLYVPKLRVTFYLYKMATGKFVAILMPIVFAFAANTYNILRCFKQEGTDFADYLANNVALGLAVTFVVPYLLEEAESLTVYYYIIWIFGSFLLSLTAYFWHEPLDPNGRGPKRSQMTWAHLVIIFQWASLIIPFYNWTQYHRVMKKIRSNWTEKKDLRMTFLGRPGSVSDWEQKYVKKNDTGKAANKKGSQDVLNDLRTFVVKTGDPKKPKIKLNPEILSHNAQTTTYTEAGPARKGRCEPWQFDERNHYIYCGLHRNYFQDKDVAKAIDHDKHNVPFQRKKNHEPIG